PLDLGERDVDVGLVADIRRDTQHAVDLLGLEIEHGDARAEIPERLDDAASDPAGTARDHGDPALDSVQLHQFLRSMSWMSVVREKRATASQSKISPLPGRSERTRSPSSTRWVSASSTSTGFAPESYGIVSVSETAARPPASWPWSSTNACVITGFPSAASTAATAASMPPLAVASMRSTSAAAARSSSASRPAASSPAAIGVSIASASARVSPG